MIVQVPVWPGAHDGHAIGERDLCELAWAEASDGSIDGVATPDETGAHEIQHRRRVDIGRKARKGPKGLELRGERQATVELRDVERLFSHAIAREPELAGLRVPRGEREHARHSWKASSDAP